MRHTLTILACCALPLSIGACGDEFSNAPFEDDARFVAAAPSGAQLRIGVGGLAGLSNAAIHVDELAETYVATRRVSLQLNAFAFGLLRDVDDLVTLPPTEREAGRRLWSPAPHALDATESRFEMVTDGAGGFDYALSQRRRTEPGDATFAPVMTGAFTPDDAGGVGQLTLDMTALAAITGGPQRGRVHVDYEISGAAVTLAIAFEDVAFADEPPSNAQYAYARAADGSGVFDFAFDEDGTLTELRSRWLIGGAGRADVRVTSGASTQLWSECWGPDFRQVYIASEAGALGSVDACAFAEASPPGS